MAVLQDARYAVRAMRHSPGFTLTATLALALGIGANTAIFSLVYGVLLKGLPYPNADRLIALLTIKNGDVSDAHSLPDIADLRAGSSTLDALAGYSGGTLTLADGRDSRALPAAFITPDLFTALGVAPQRGRAFAAADDARGAPRTAIISDTFWTRRYERAESAVGAADPGLPVEKITTMGEHLAQSVAEPRFNSFLLGGFALLALALSALGIYGVMACSVTQRTREIGIRPALGAQPSAVLRLIVGQGMRTALIGMAIGLGGALALSRLLAALVYGIGVRDLPTFSAVSALLGVIALAACYLPARRAMRISPTIALRTE